MEIVINNCYGGFSLSDKAEDLYAEKSGFNIYRYEQTKYKFECGEDEYRKCQGGSGYNLTYTFKKDHGDSFKDFPDDKDDGYWYSRNIPRDDKILIEVVKELGEEANGMCANLKVIDVPEGIEWEIEEYDGNEWVAEKHRTWG